ncbi:MAG TPA: amidohydrolase family protein [bacterium]|nr:amidohydrolase family protein [bacterium]
MNPRLVLFAKYILTLDRPQPLEDGFVMIQGNRIVQVGKRKDLYFLPSVRMLDLGDTILLPGLINAHCHLDFTALKGKVSYRGVFIDWLKRMGQGSRGTTPAGFRQSVARGIRESLTQGTTTICDIATSWESWGLLRRSGMRSFVFVELFDLVEKNSKDYWERFLDRLQEAVRTMPPTPLFRWGLSPHTPFTVSKELLRWVTRYLDSHRDLLTTIHVGESREEARLFKSGKGPLAKTVERLNPSWVMPHNTTPTQYLNGFGWLPKLDLGVHLNAVNSRDMRLLAKNRITVVHCPGSHHFFKHLPFRYKELRRHRVSVCLGTDSLASNQSLSMFREMRLFQKENPEVPAVEILSMVTVKPAQALGMGGQLGQIKPGFLGDLIGVPLRRSKGRRGDLAQQVIDYRGPVSFSMINGESKLRLSPDK